MARIEFKQESNGTVSYSLVVEEGESAVDPHVMAAFCMAKRGLTKRDTERYKLHGAFTMEVK